MIRRLALVLAAGLPLCAAAQTPPASVADPAAAAAPAPAPAVTVDLGGWLVFNSFFDFGGTNSTDLPQRAAGLRSEIATGMQVRQSRLRANLGLPGGGLLGDAKVKGLLELDFMGGAVGGDQSLPLVRLRHAWAAATWKELGNLTLTVGQTWGIFTGPYFAASLGHLAVPRFAGAGFLFRRAPQVRLSGDVGREISIQWAAGLLAPMDKATPNPAVPSGAGVGERSGLPDVEARAALVFRPASKNMAEVGASIHYGQDRYLAGAGNKTVPSQGVSVDFKIDVSAITLLGAGFAGKNLDVFATAALGVRLGAGTPPASADAVATQGAWAQLQVTPVAGLQLLVGGGLETPKLADVPAVATAVKRNGQLSGGVILNLAPRWRAAVEYTHYVTSYNAANSRYVSNQAEVSTLYAF